MTYDAYDYINLTERYSAPIYRPLPVVLEDGQGVWVWDNDGEKYLDCLSAYSAVNQGHNHPLIQTALIKQSRKLSITCTAFYNRLLGPFLEKLCHICQMDMALPMTTGAEAVESSTKLARNWGYATKGIVNAKAEIITCQNNVHGSIQNAVSILTGSVATKVLAPLAPGVTSIPFGNASALENAITKNTVAFLVEPIQCANGVSLPPNGYLKQIREICTNYDILLIFDERQTGLGRTGKLFAYQYEDAKPNMLLLGQALSGGMYPVSAIVGDHHVLSLLNTKSQGGTYDVSPLACAVSDAALDVIIDENLPDASAEMGAYFLAGLKKINSPHIQNIRGRGLILEIDLKDTSGTALNFSEKLLALGILSQDIREKTLRLTPPLIISKAEIDWCLKHLSLALLEETHNEE